MTFCFRDSLRLREGHVNTLLSTRRCSGSHRLEFKFRTCFSADSHRSAPTLHCEKQSSLASPNVIMHTKISRTNYAQCAVQHSPRNRAKTARNKTARNKRLKPLAFTSVRAHIYCRMQRSHSSYFQTSTLSHSCHTKCNLLPELPTG